MQIAVFDLDDTVVTGDTFVRFLITCLRRRPMRVLRCVHLPIALVMHFGGMKDNTWLKTVFLRAIVGGLTRQQIASIALPYVAQTLEKHTKAAALEAIHRHREAGQVLVLASASPDLYVAEMGRQLGFDQVVATRVAFRTTTGTEAPMSHDDVCTGDLQGGNCYGPNKVTTLKTVVSAEPQHYVAAYSDHHSDLPLLQLANQGYAVDPSDKLRDAANEYDLEILEWA